MWLYCQFGFYSVVHKPPGNKDELLVRTRSRVDIDTLQKTLKEKYQFDGEVIDSPKADYAHRMTVPRETFASFMSGIAMEMNYDNFKNTISRNDYKRHEAYIR